MRSAASGGKTSKRMHTIRKKTKPTAKGKEGYGGEHLDRECDILPGRENGSQLNTQVRMAPRGFEGEFHRGERNTSMGEKKFLV